MIEEDLGRRAGGREEPRGEEPGGEVVQARDEGINGERHGGVGDERVVLGGDAERGAREIGATADGDAGLRVEPGEPPDLLREALPRRPGVLGGDPRGVEGIVQHHPQRGPSAAFIRVPSAGAGTGPEGVGSSPLSLACGQGGGGSGVAAETGRGSPHRRAAHGVHGGEWDSLDREVASRAVETVIFAGELLSGSVR